MFNFLRRKKQNKELWFRVIEYSTGKVFVDMPLTAIMILVEFNNGFYNITENSFLRGDFIIKFYRK